LNVHRSATPNSTYDSFDKSLGREAAKAAGSSVEDMTGDYSQTSFSASRLAMEGPWRINLRRRQAITESLYRATFMAWLEEACETGRVKLPKGAPAFWEAPSAYGRSIWRGSSKPVADPLKDVAAKVMAIENGLATYEQILGESGHDFEETMIQRRSEKERFAADGLVYPVPQNRPDIAFEEDAPTKQ
jgi:capsid protein